MSRAAASVTPLILTHDEEANLSRTLASLRWARRIVVVDSGSSDGTQRIAATCRNVNWHVRVFDNHRNQWMYGIHETGIETDYVLALDADMPVSKAFVQEMEAVFLPASPAGGVVPFRYWRLGRPLWRSILRPQLRLFRRTAVQVSQGGHTQEFRVKGPLYHFKAPILHDDRKCLERWVESQLKYAVLEQQRLARPDSRALKDRVRRAGIMPLIAGALAYAKAGGPFRGRAALMYAWERVVYECLLSMRLLESGSTRRERKDAE